MLRKLAISILVVGIIGYVGLSQDTRVATVGAAFHCPNNTIVTLTAGEGDFYDDDADSPSASPSQGMIQRTLNLGHPLSKMVDFDYAGLDKIFAHTFTGLTGQIIEASIEIRMKPNGGGSTNDILGLRFTDNNGNFVGRWDGRIGSDSNNPSIVPETWSSSNFESVLFRLNLKELHEQPNNDSITNLLPLIQSLDYLDVYVQDDTGVDYVQLKLCKG